MEEDPVEGENVESELVTTKSGQPEQAPKVMTLSEELFHFSRVKITSVRLFRHKKRVDHKL